MSFSLLIRRLSFLCALPLVASIFPGCVSAATFPSLGLAAGYGVFATDSFTLSGSSVVNGNVGVGQSYSFSSPAIINGAVYLNSTATGNSNVTPTDGIQTTTSSGVIASALNAATQFGALTATQTLSSLGNNAVLNGDGYINVVDVGSVNLTNSSLTLKGNANDYFVINVTGNFSLSSSSMILSGVSASHIIFNIDGTMHMAGTGSGSNFYGTFLDANNSITVGSGTLYGQLIGENITDGSAFTLFNSTFTTPPSTPPPAPPAPKPDPTSVPEPGTYLSSCASLLIICVLARRRLRTAASTSVA